MRKSPRNYYVPLVALVCVLSLVCATSAYAQTVASVTGRVTDRQGAGVPGATVTLYSRERPAESIQTVTERSKA